jgi:hypothetical protein
VRRRRRTISYVSIMLRKMVKVVRNNTQENSISAAIAGYKTHATRSASNTKNKVIAIIVEELIPYISPDESSTKLHNSYG